MQPLSASQFAGESATAEHWCDGKYRIVAKLGQGGMADVYLALVLGPIPEVQKLVVLKRLRAGLRHDPGFMQMFVEEARIAARFNHPNVVQTNALEVHDGDPVIVMEYLEGITFDRLLSHSRDQPFLDRLPLVGAVSRMLAGLAYVHELRDYDDTPLDLVHRDVKPANVFVTFDGHIKLVDFGVAKCTSGVDVTMGGLLKGTPGYMAPEILDSPPRIDSRADLFAAGAILWEIVYGRPLWAGCQQLQVLSGLARRQLPEFDRPSEDVPAELVEICRRALSPNPIDRQASAAELRGDLDCFLRAHSAPDTPSALATMVYIGFSQVRRARSGAVLRQVDPLRGGPTSDGPVEQLPSFGRPVKDMAAADSTESVAAEARGATMIASDAVLRASNDTPGGGTFVADLSQMSPDRGPMGSLEIEATIVRPDLTVQRSYESTEAPEADETIVRPDLDTPVRYESMRAPKVEETIVRPDLDAAANYESVLALEADATIVRSDLDLPQTFRAPEVEASEVEATIVRSDLDLPQMYESVGSAEVEATIAYAGVDIPETYESVGTPEAGSTIVCSPLDELAGAFPSVGAGGAGRALTTSEEDDFAAVVEATMARLAQGEPVRADESAVSSAVSSTAGRTIVMQFDGSRPPGRERPYAPPILVPPQVRASAAGPMSSEAVARVAVEPPAVVVPLANAGDARAPLGVGRRLRPPLIVIGACGAVLALLLFLFGSGPAVTAQAAPPVAAQAAPPVAAQAAPPLGAEVEPRVVSPAVQPAEPAPPSSPPVVDTSPGGTPSDDVGAPAASPPPDGDPTDEAPQPDPAEVLAEQLLEDQARVAERKAHKKQQRQKRQKQQKQQKQQAGGKDVGGALGRSRTDVPGLPGRFFHP